MKNVKWYVTAVLGFLVFWAEGERAKLHVIYKRNCAHHIGHAVLVNALFQFSFIPIADSLLDEKCDSPESENVTDM